MQQSHGTGFPFIGVVVVGRREAVAEVLCNDTSVLDPSFFVSGSFDIVVFVRIGENLVYLRFVSQVTST